MGKEHAAKRGYPHFRAQVVALSALEQPGKREQGDGKGRSRDDRSLPYKVDPVDDIRGGGITSEWRCYQ